MVLLSVSCTTTRPDLDDLPRAALTAEELVERLGAPHFEERQSAQDTLIAMGELILPTLRTATRHTDPEINHRVRGILGSIELVSLPEYQGPGVVWVVSQEQALADIAKEHGVELGFLRKVNRLAHAGAIIRTGQRIIIPVEK